MRIVLALLLPTLLLPPVMSQAHTQVGAGDRERLLPVQANRRPDAAASQAEAQRLLDALARDRKSVV